jgi:hypothetical protein
MPTPPRRDLGTRVAEMLSSQALNALIGIIGLATPAVAWAMQQKNLTNILLIVETILLLLMIANYMWLRRIYIQLRRANDRDMADAKYFALIRAQLEQELIADFGEIADGHLQVYASEVPRLSVMLFRILIESGSEPKRVLAADLTTNPSLLTARREYLAVNRHLIACSSAGPTTWPRRASPARCWSSSTTTGPWAFSAPWLCATGCGPTRPSTSSSSPMPLSWWRRSRGMPNTSAAARRCTSSRWSGGRAGSSRPGVTAPPLHRSR